MTSCIHFRAITGVNAIITAIAIPLKKDWPVEGCVVVGTASRTDAFSIRRGPASLAITTIVDRRSFSSGFLGGNEDVSTKLRNFSYNVGESFTPEQVFEMSDGYFDYDFASASARSRVLVCPLRCSCKLVVIWKVGFCLLEHIVGEVLQRVDVIFVCNRCYLEV